MKPLRECVVLVTPRSFGLEAPELRAELERSVGAVRYNSTGRPLKSSELRGRMAEVDGLLAGLDEIDGAVFACSPRLRVVARYGAGVSNVDLEAARAHDVVVTNTPGANSEGVAELTIGFMFALARSIPRNAALVRSGLWSAGAGVEIAGRTLGLIGLGRIGRSVAGRALDLGCKVLAYDPYVDGEQISGIRIERVDLDTLLRASDFLSLHLPVTDETAGMVNMQFLGHVRSGSYLINTARGELLVEADVLRALENGLLRGAALDTLCDEPPDPNDPLVQHPAVIVTPHIGAHTAEAMAAMGRLALDNLLAVLSGRPPHNPVISERASQHVAV